MKSIYDYTDYRSFLSERFQEIKKQKPKFSHRYISKYAGFSSASFFKTIINGKRMNLTKNNIAGLIRVFRLSAEEGHYFKSMVCFAHAESHEERDRFLRDMLTQQLDTQKTDLKKAQYDLFSRWYYLAILELVRLDTQQPKNLKWLRHQLKPEVPPQDVAKAVKALIALDLLEATPAKEFIRKETVLMTPESFQSMAIVNLHREMSRLAGMAIQFVPYQQRSFGLLTVATSLKTYQRVQQELQAFRRRLHGLLEKNDGPKEVVAHINLQLFPLNSDQ